MEDVNKPRRKKVNKINNVNNNILGIMLANCFLEVLKKQKPDIIKWNEYIEYLLLDHELELSVCF